MPIIRTLLSFLCLAVLVCSQSVLAVDQSRLWLPKKYDDAKPKLLAAAVVGRGQ